MRSTGGGNNDAAGNTLQRQSERSGPITNQ